MTDPTMAQPDAWATIAAELHRIADDAEKLIGHVPPGLVSLDIQPNGGISHPPILEDRAPTIQAVDDVAHALFGKAAATRPMSDGKSVHHTASMRRGPIFVSIYQAVAAVEGDFPDGSSDD